MREEEVVRDVLELKVVADAWLDHIIDWPTLAEHNLWRKIDVELSREALELLL